MSARLSATSVTVISQIPARDRDLHTLRAHVSNRAMFPGHVSRASDSKSAIHVLCFECARPPLSVNPSIVLERGRPARTDLMVTVLR